MNPFLIVLIIFILTILMVMSGRGGGNFYVAALVLSNVPMHTASTKIQFILLLSSLMGTFVFGKAKKMSLPLAFFFGGINATSVFFGGFYAHKFGGVTLEFVACCSAYYCYRFFSGMVGISEVHSLFL